MGFKPFPIGVDNFREMIQEGYYYVDKTLLIKELLDMRGKVNLFTRPRRFGKTLGLSMLQCFFEKDYCDARKLFQGLEIMAAGEKYLKHISRYPVISISLKTMKQANFDLSYIQMKKMIAEEFGRHEELLKIGKLTEEEKERFLAIRDVKGTDADYLDALRFLSACLAKSYREKVIILIDEYDVPLENSYFGGFYEKMIPLIRSLFESALKTNDSLEFAVITGCLRISKESIFTGLNNLKIISITNPMYSEHFGFTQKEVDEILAFYDRSDFADVVKRWYDGYVFGRTEVYNPWSVLNYVELIWADMTSLPRPFWANTSSNSIVKTLVEKADIKVKQEIELLIQGESIEKPIHEDITYEDIGVEESEENIWNFLFFTGYLKKVDEALRDGIRYISMSIPNEEILYIYKNTVLSWFGKKVKKKDFSELYRYVTEGEVIGLEKTISELLREGISFYDTKEAFYHGFLMGIFGGMGDYYSYSNRESGDGRYDICLKSMDVEKPVILFELKVSESFHQMEKCSLKAVEQIRMKHYEEEFLRDGYREVLCYGIAFYKKNCKITVEKQKIES